MGFGVFIHRSDSIYDDRPDEQYQFPAVYLSRAQQCVGDWIVYYEPTKVRNTRGYFALAKVRQIIRDPSVPKMHLAIIEPGSYLPLANTVQFTDSDGLIEQGLLNDEGYVSGRAQSAVRALSSTDFARITRLGFPDTEADLPRVGAPSQPGGFADQQDPFEVPDQIRERIGYLTSRPLRDRIFRRIVLSAYDSRCAVTGLKLINGGGRAEVEAAHIRPVEQNGPDLVNNGLALSGTAHWMFDRGLIGVGDGYEILISDYVNDRDGVRSLVNPSGRLLPPINGTDRPYVQFLRWHRENFFKG